jgi:hypothetical protein
MTCRLRRRLMLAQALRSIPRDFTTLFTYLHRLAKGPQRSPLCQWFSGRSVACCSADHNTEMSAL